MSTTFTNVYRLFQAGGQLFFVAGEVAADDAGAELWRTDGTAAGTQMVKDIWTGDPGSDPWLTGDLGGLLLFTARKPDEGEEPWLSDGTASGTYLLADIFPDYPGSNLSDVTVVAGIAFFGANDGLTGQEPWAIQPTCPAQLDLHGRRVIGDYDFEAAGQIATLDFRASNGAILSMTAADSITLGANTAFAAGVSVTFAI
ncbi:MAG: hypothetical protein VKQ33_16695, partial [Candidatus Sericytochromatia bacterium]|nr:hypothetical protein [Candidatus Sericytochromatia bacterium]